MHSRFEVLLVYLSVVFVACASCRTLRFRVSLASSSTALVSRRNCSSPCGVIHLFLVWLPWFPMELYLCVFKVWGFCLLLVRLFWFPEEVVGFHEQSLRCRTLRFGVSLASRSVA